MKATKLGYFLGASAVTLATTLVSNNSALSQQPNFFCGTENGFPATIVQSPEHGDVAIIRWQSDRVASSGYNNQTRCNIVSRKFQNFYDQGTLNFFTANNSFISESGSKEKIICAVANQNDPCNGSSLLFTLNPKKDANEQLKQLFDIRAGATTEALEETESRIYLDFETFLQEKADNSQSRSPVQVPPRTTTDSNKVF